MPFAFPPSSCSPSSSLAPMLPHSTLGTIAPTRSGQPRSLEVADGSTEASPGPWTWTLARHKPVSGPGLTASLMGLGRAGARPATVAVSLSANPTASPRTHWLSLHWTSSAARTSLTSPLSMASTSPWTSARLPTGAPVGSSARPTSMASALPSWRRPAVATTPAPCSRPTSIVATLEAVDPRISRNSSRIGALMLTVTLRMIRPALSPALVEPTIGLCSALEVRVELQRILHKRLMSK